jgi:polysaccharide biosynthesis/export protein
MSVLENAMRSARLLALAALTLPVAACTGFLPEGGPSQFAASNTATVSLGSSQEQTRLPFVLIAPTIEQAIALHGEPDRYGALPQRNQREVRARIGDLVLVTIFEAGSGGLFTSPQSAGAAGGGGNFINLPAQPVDVNGNITVPYAGSIRVAGRPFTAVQKEIEEKLKDRAIEPQAILTLSAERASTVSILGSVKSGGQFPVRNTRMRILDAIAQAGGVDGAAQSLEVVLQRDGQASRVSMRRLVLDSSANTSVLPGDTIFVQPNSRAVNVFGATGESTRVIIDVDNLTLTDALTRAKGFSDARADVSSVFILRMEDRKAIPASTENLVHFTSQKVPTVYHIRYDTPGGIFIGNHMKVRSGDVVYVSNAAGVQTRKLLEMINLVLRPVAITQGILTAE